MPLTKTTTTLHLLTWKHPHFYGLSSDGVDSSIKHLEMNNDAWSDMNCPSVITVTVESGDKLNEEG